MTESLNISKIFFGFYIFFVCKLSEIMMQPQPLDPAIALGKAPKAHEPVVIVGGGLAGISAALEALRFGASVILVDKEADLGGNSAKASSGINGCDTPIQEKMGIKDSQLLFYSDTLAAGDRENDPVLVDILVHNSAQSVQFLIDNGVNLSDVNLCGGHSVPRTHWLLSPKEGRPLPVGVAIIRALKAKLEEWRDPEKFNEKEPRLKIKLNRRVLGLVTWNDFVTGVRVLGDNGQIEEIAGKAVILTTGGFSADREKDKTSLLLEFAPSLLSFPTTNGRFATGDGVKMARAMGAGLVGMDKIQVHPTAFIDPKDPGATTKFLAAEALRGKGAILINHEGKRFGNELGRRDELTKLIIQHCARQKEAGDMPIAWMLMNKESAESFGMPAFNFYFKIKGFFKELPNINSLATELNASEDDLIQTINDYNNYAEKRNIDKNFKDPFGKSVFPVKFNINESLFVARIAPAIHYTMGGLQIDKNGLLAAGEVTGGVHGANRLAGNSLLECVVFGRIAGKSAAAIDYQSALLGKTGRSGIGADAQTNEERQEL
uniref:fumarate reductase (NADH) n=1 Tax=Meloidogyne incognita TaxID=6306 RepID=A0A914M3C1_MELIC